MKILKERDSFLSNYEVRQHMSSIKESHNWVFDQDEPQSRNKHRSRGTAGGLDLEVITRDVLAYLAASDVAHVTSETLLVALGDFLNKFDLVKVEKLQIINSLPRSMVHLYALVEECGLRFDENACTSIIQKIDELFPLPQVPDDDQEDVEDGAAPDNDAVPGESENNVEMNDL